MSGGNAPPPSPEPDIGGLSLSEYIVWGGGAGVLAPPRSVREIHDDIRLIDAYANAVKALGVCDWNGNVVHSYGDPMESQFKQMVESIVSVDLSRIRPIVWSRYPEIAREREGLESELQRAPQGSGRYQNLCDCIKRNEASVEQVNQRIAVVLHDAATRRDAFLRQLCIDHARATPQLRAALAGVGGGRTVGEVRDAWERRGRALALEALLGGHRTVE